MTQIVSQNNFNDIINIIEQSKSRALKAEWKPERRRNSLRAKDDAVVEYALSRSLSPTMVADYTLQLPDKKLLEEKLREITLLTEKEEK